MKVTLTLRGDEVRCDVDPEGDDVRAPDAADLAGLYLAHLAKGVGKASPTSCPAGHTVLELSYYATQSALTYTESQLED